MESESWQHSSGCTFQFSECASHLQAGIEKCEFGVGQPALFAEHVEETQLAKLIRLSNYSQVLGRLADYAIPKQIVCAHRRCPAFVCTLHFERNSRFKMLTAETGARCACGGGLDRALIPALRHQRHRDSDTQSVVSIP